MSIRDSGVLFDITTRLALFVEGVKLGQLAEFDAVLSAVDDELRKLFKRVNYKTLDGLSKAELNRLLVALRKSQLRIYTAYTEKLIADLQEFMRLRIDVSAVAYGSAKYNFLQRPGNEPFTEDTFTQLSEARAFSFIARQSEREPFTPLFGIGAATGAVALWPKIINAPIPANGLYLLTFLQTFSRSAQATVENTIRKAWANKQSVEDTLAELNGRRAVQGHSTQFARIKQQANAVIETAFAHVDQISAQAVVSAIFNHYQWISVIDNATTDVCRERDENVYRYGDGPIPPAHYRCRSVTVPLASLFGDFKAPTLYAWLKRQPYPLQVEFLGKAGADALKSGELTSKDFGKLQIGKLLSLTQFKSKLGLILLT